MNYGEGNQLSEHMLQLGHSKAESAEDADIVILNTCTVVDTTEKKMLRRMSELRKQGKEVIVTGCMAKVQTNRIEIRLPGSLIIPPGDYDSFPLKVGDRYGKGEPIPINDVQQFCILPIAQGCIGNCTYCITRFAREGLTSYPEAELLDRFRKMVDNGAKEILISAQDVACYGRDTKTDLADLIGKMLEIDGDYRLRIGMMNPNSLRPVLDKLMDIMEDPRVYRFLHIPVQSGSNDVLKAMKRHYTVEEFMTLVETIRGRYPDISIATDIITGFPGETDADHNASLDLIRKLRADTINITRFSPRPGTEAALMEPVHGRICKERSTEMTEVKNDTEYDVNKALIGKRFEALVTEYGREGSVIARTCNYRPIALSENIPLGTFIDAEVTDCRSTYLIGKVVK